MSSIFYYSDGILNKFCEFLIKTNPESFIFPFGSIDYLMENGIKRCSTKLTLPKVQPKIIYCVITFSYGKLLGINKHMWNHMSLVSFNLETGNMMHYDATPNSSKSRLLAIKKNFKNTIAKLIRENYGLSNRFYYDIVTLNA
jgi:hypothetical protein